MQARIASRESASTFHVLLLLGPHLESLLDAMIQALYDFRVLYCAPDCIERPPCPFPVVRLPRSCTRLAAAHLPTSVVSDVPRGQAIIEDVSEPLRRRYLLDLRLSDRIANQQRQHCRSEHILLLH